MAVFMTSMNSGTFTVTATETIVVTVTRAGHSFGHLHETFLHAAIEMHRFASALLKCRIPETIWMTWITAAERPMPRKSAKVGGVAAVRPAIRPERARAVHHGEHLLNFYRC